MLPKLIFFPSVKIITKKENIHMATTVLLAAAPIASLCKINKLIREFERTASRLYEMTIIKPS